MANRSKSAVPNNDPSMRLSIINEDGDHQPTPSTPKRPPRTPNGGRSPNTDPATPPSTHLRSPSHRPWSRRWRDRPPSHDFEARPPSYLADEPLRDVELEKVRGWRRLERNRHVARRGGWKRVAVIILFLLIILGLGLGLGLGLRNRNNGTSSSSLPPSRPAFPAGSYTIVTYLLTASTSCVGNPSTFRCWPYTTYKPSNEQASLSTFDWIITQNSTTSTSSGPNGTFTVQSSSNPFAITIPLTTLTLDGQGTDDEAYTFDIGLPKSVIPDQPITSDQRNTICWFNNTRFSARLYTRRQSAELPNNNGTSVETVAGASTDGSDTNRSGSFVPWPFAVEIKQSVVGGADTPACYETENGAQGSRLHDQSLGGKGEGDVCECAYANFGL